MCVITMNVLWLLLESNFINVVGNVKGYSHVYTHSWMNEVSQIMVMKIC